VRKTLSVRQVSLTLSLIHDLLIRVIRYPSQDTRRLGPGTRFAYIHTNSNTRILRSNIEKSPLAKLRVAREAPPQRTRTCPPKTEREPLGARGAQGSCPPPRSRSHTSHDHCSSREREREILSAMIFHVVHKSTPSGSARPAHSEDQARPTHQRHSSRLCCGGVAALPRPEHPSILSECSRSAVRARASRGILAASSELVLPPPQPRPTSGSRTPPRSSSQVAQRERACSARRLTHPLSHSVERARAPLSPFSAEPSTLTERPRPTPWAAP
jgi:hypothetical protein